MAGRSFEDFQNELQHSGDSIQIEVERGRRCELDDGNPIELESGGIQPLRPNKLGSNFAALEGNSSGRATPPSPSRRRLPQAPVAVTPSGNGPDSATSIFVIYRLQIKIKSSVERNGTSCLVIAVISAEKSSPLQPHHEGAERSPTANRQQSSEEESYVWIQVALKPPKYDYTSHPSFLLFPPFFFFIVIFFLYSNPQLTSISLIKIASQLSISRQNRIAKRTLW